MDKKNTFWQTERGKAAIKLILWAIFIVILIVIVLFSERDTIREQFNNSGEDNTTVETPKPAEEEDFLSFTTMQENLLNNNYEYVYTISNSLGTYIYIGIKNPDKEMGYREDSNGIIKYFIMDDVTYRVNLDTTEVITDLYLNVDASYLNLEVLFANLSEYLYTTNTNQDIRTITYNKEGYQVIITTNTSMITNITIMVDDTTYDLDYYLVGESRLIDFTL